MSILLEKLTFTERRILTSLNCNYQLLISKIKGLVTIWIRVIEIKVTQVPCDILSM